MKCKNFQIKFSAVEKFELRTHIFQTKFKLTHNMAKSIARAHPEYPPGIEFGLN